ncbi:MULTISPECIES: DinB family protein [Antarcticibacterium]|uniref:DinB family protein n=1 Tax=Antarcticibacterium TaxID=2058174 RepID=UPI001FEABDAF|nr:DinB family protein [Antarcticibacterium flavum]
MTAEQQIKARLIKHLEGGEAFMPVQEMLKYITYERVGERPGNLPYSFYELFYHIWYAQKDILEYCKAEDYAAPKWPEDYWPPVSKPDTQAEWKELQEAFFQTRKELIFHLESSELLQPVGNDTEHNLLREIMLVIEHNAYHIGQLMILLRELGLYK